MQKISLDLLCTVGFGCRKTCKVVSHGGEASSGRNGAKEDLKMLRVGKCKHVLPTESKAVKQLDGQEQLDSGMCEEGIHCLPKGFVSEHVGQESAVTLAIAFLVLLLQLPVISMKTHSEQCI